MISQKKKVMMMGASAPGSPLFYKTGTVTLDGSKTSITVNPGVTDKPLFAFIVADSPTYGADGCAASMYMRMSETLVVRYGGANQNTSAHGMVFESRTSFANYLSPSSSNGNNWVNATTGAITFYPRASSYPFLAGTYHWYAVYGDIYEEVGT